MEKAEPKLLTPQEKSARFSALVKASAELIGIRQKIHDADRAMALGWNSEKSVAKRERVVAPLLARADEILKPFSEEDKNKIVFAVARTS